MVNETSLHDSQPRWEYRFERGAQSWSFDSRATPIKHSGAAQQAEQARRTLSIEVTLDFPLLDDWRALPPTETTRVSILRFEPDWSSRMIWDGRVVAVTFDAARATLACEDAGVALGRAGLRRLYSKLCPHVLHGAACGVAPAPVAATVVAAAGLEVRLSGTHGVDAYAGGWLQTTDGVLRAMIVANGAQQATLLYAAPFAPGQAVQAYAGCNHTLQACRDKFANLDNFGGFPWIPAKNPFATGVF